MDARDGGLALRKPRAMRCSYCMEKWRLEGEKKDEQPRAFFPKDIQDGQCPNCGKKFRNYSCF